MKLLQNIVSASVLGLLVGVLGIYLTVRDRSTHLTMDIAAESNVLDVVHPIPELAILFQGQDIERERSNLKVLTVRVMNDGESNIHEDDFDSHMPFGLQVDGGTIVRAQVAGSNAPYLAENLHPQLQPPNRVLFDKIIFDKRKFVALELLVLHGKEQQPQVRALGKIAGLDGIPVTNSFRDHSQQGFWEQVFQGPPVVQITRAVTYGIAMLISSIAIGFAIGGLVSLVSRWKKSRRRRLAARVRSPADPGQQKLHGALEALYIERGASGLRDLLGVLERQRFQRAHRISSGHESPPRPGHPQAGEAGTVDFFSRFEPLYHEFVRLEDDGEWVVDPSLESPAQGYLEQILALK